MGSNFGRRADGGGARADVGLGAFASVRTPCFASAQSAESKNL